MRRGQLSPEEFERIVLDASAWEQTADALLGAAQPMRDSVAIFMKELRQNRWPDDQQRHNVQVYFMLCAYALENLFKARLVQTNRPALERKLQHRPGTLPKLLASHDLVNLAVRAGMKHFADEERFVFERLSAASFCDGRYPDQRTTSDFG